VVPLQDLVQDDPVKETAQGESNEQPAALRPAIQSVDGHVHRNRFP